MKDIDEFMMTDTETTIVQLICLDQVKLQTFDFIMLNGVAGDARETLLQCSRMLNLANRLVQLVYTCHTNFLFMNRFSHVTCLTGRT